MNNEWLIDVVDEANAPAQRRFHRTAGPSVLSMFMSSTIPARNVAQVTKQSIRAYGQSTRTGRYSNVRRPTCTHLVNTVKEPRNKKEIAIIQLLTAES